MNEATKTSRLYGISGGSILAGTSLTITAAFIMQRPIVHGLTFMDLSNINRIVSHFNEKSEMFRSFKRVFGAYSLLDLKTSLSSEQMYSLLNILSKKDGLKSLEILMKNKALRWHISAITSIPADSLNVVNNILAGINQNPAFKNLFGTTEGQKALRALLRAKNGAEGFFDVLSGKSTEMKTAKLQALLNKLLAINSNLTDPSALSHFISLFPDKESVAALCQLLENKQQAQALLTITNLSGIDPATFKVAQNLLKAQASHVPKATFNTATYTGLILAGSLIIGFALFLVTARSILENRDIIAEKKELSTNRVLGTILCSSLLGTSIVTTSAILLMQIKQFKGVFVQEPSTAYSVALGSSVLLFIAVTIVMTVLITLVTKDLCSSRITDATICEQVTDTSEQVTDTKTI